MIKPGLIYTLAVLFILENAMYIMLSKIIFVYYLQQTDYVEWQAYRIYRSKHTRIFSSRRFDAFFKMHNRLTILFYFIIIANFLFFLINECFIIYASPEIWSYTN